MCDLFTLPYIKSTRTDHISNLCLLLVGQHLTTRKKMATDAAAIVEKIPKRAILEMNKHVEEEIIKGLTRTLKAKEKQAIAMLLLMPAFDVRIRKDETIPPSSTASAPTIIEHEQQATCIQLPTASAPVKQEPLEIQQPAVKRTRTNFTKQAQNHLFMLLRQNLYPTRQAKEETAAFLGLTYAQVSGWYTNNRTRARSSNDKEELKIRERQNNASVQCDTELVETRLLM